MRGSLGRLPSFLKRRNLYDQPDRPAASLLWSGHLTASPYRPQVSKNFSETYGQPRGLVRRPSHNRDFP